VRKISLIKMRTTFMKISVRGENAHDLQRQCRALEEEHAQLSRIRGSLHHQGQQVLSDEIETQQQACQQRQDVLRRGLLIREGDKA